MKAARFFSIVLILLILCFPSFATAVTRHYVHHGLTEGKNDGSSWVDAWRDVDNINWSALQSEASTQPVYLYFKKGVTISNNDMIIRGSGSSDTNRIILTVDPSDSGSTPVFDGGYSTNYPIDVRGNYITIENFHITRAYYCNIFQYNTDADYVTIQDCLIDYARGDGIYSGNTNNHPTEGPKGDYWIIRRCLFDNNGTSQTSQRHGIYVRYGDNWTIEYCKFTNHLYGFATQGQSGADNWVVRYNYSENNGNMKGAGGYSMAATDGSAAATINWQIYGNISNGDNMGICINNGPSTTTNGKIYNNTILNATGIGIYFANNNNAASLYNNIVWNSGTKALYVNPGGSITNIDNNDFGPAKSSYIAYNGNYSTLVAWKAGPGGDNEISSDPLLTDSAGRDFSLTPSSPCKDAGKNGLGSSYKGLPASWRWDVGCNGSKQSPTLLNQDSYGTAWDIGAFIYSGEPSSAPYPPSGLRVISP